MNQTTVGKSVTAFANMKVKVDVFVVESQGLFSTLSNQPNQWKCNPKGGSHQFMVYTFTNLVVLANMSNESTRSSNSVIIMLSVELQSCKASMVIDRKCCGKMLEWEISF